MECDVGDPAARTSSPWSPPRPNFTDTTWPARTEFMLGKGRIGSKKPLKS